MRTKLAVIAFGALAVSAAPAAAELPPHYQRVAELKAVLENSGVAAAFGINQLIDRVEYVRRDLYRVTAGRCHIDVAIVGQPTPPGVSGGRRFDVRPGRRVCRGGRR